MMEAFKKKERVTMRQQSSWTGPKLLWDGMTTCQWPRWATSWGQTLLPPGPATPGLPRITMMCCSLTLSGSTMWAWVVLTDSIRIITTCALKSRARSGFRPLSCGCRTGLSRMPYSSTRRMVVSSSPWTSRGKSCVLCLRQEWRWGGGTLLTDWQAVHAWGWIDSVQLCWPLCCG